VVTVQELQEQRAVVNSSSTQENLNFLSKIGHYYEQTIPSKLEHAFIFETEKLINDLYVKSLQDTTAQKITEQLLEALSQVGPLAISVNNKNFGSDFIKTAKQLGRTLIRISRLK